MPTSLNDVLFENIYIIKTHNSFTITNISLLLKNKTEKGIPFVVTFHPRLKILQKIIDKNLYLLYINEEA